jgi:hypothetical protein
MVAIGANSQFVVRQTRTSLQMIEEHYGSVRVALDKERATGVEPATSSLGR